MGIEVKTKKWGNSLGIIIPYVLVEKLKLKPREKITIEITHKESPLKELFGALKHNKKSTKQMMDGSRKELDSKWIK